MFCYHRKLFTVYVLVLLEGDAHSLVLCLFLYAKGQPSSPAESGSFHTAASIGSQSLDSSTEVEDDFGIEVCADYQPK